MLTKAKRILTILILSVFVVGTSTLFYGRAMPFKLGDVDLDGKITPADARIVLRASVGLEEIEQATETVSPAETTEQLNISSGGGGSAATVGSATLPVRYGSSDPPKKIVLLGDSIVEGVGSSDYSRTGDIIIRSGDISKPLDDSNANYTETQKRSTGVKSWGALFKQYIESTYCNYANNAETGKREPVSPPNVTVIDNGISGWGVKGITANLTRTATTWSNISGYRFADYVKYNGATYRCKLDIKAIRNWVEGNTCNTGDRVLYEDEYYECQRESVTSTPSGVSEDWSVSGVYSDPSVDTDHWEEITLDGDKKWLLLPQNTDLAIVCAGINDRGYNEDQIYDSYIELFDALSKEKVSVIALSPIDVNGGQFITSPGRINTALERACEYSNVPYVNLYGEFNSVLTADSIYIREWEYDEAYNLGDTVRYNHDYYNCIEDVNSNEALRWVANKPYSVGDDVISGYQWYRCTSDITSATEPSGDNTHWDKVTPVSDTSHWQACTPEQTAELARHDYYSDALHPNDRGHKAIFNIVCKLLNF